MPVQPLADLAQTSGKFLCPRWMHVHVLDTFIDKSLSDLCFWHVGPAHPTQRCSIDPRMPVQPLPDLAQTSGKFLCPPWLPVRVLDTSTRSYTRV